MPALHGLVLQGDHYAVLPATTLADGALLLHSAALGLDLRLEQGRLRFFDPATGAPLLTHQEAEQALQRERAARQTAEARLAELEARLRTLEAERPPSSADDAQP